MVRLTCGPARTVTGVSSTPGSSMLAFQSRLMPFGAFMACVVSDGGWPWLIAVAA